MESRWTAEGFKRESASMQTHGKDKRQASAPDGVVMAARDVMPGELPATLGMTLMMRA